MSNNITIPCLTVDHKYVTLEDLRNIAELIPQAFQVSANALNLDVKEFKRRIKNKEILATELLPKLESYLKKSLYKSHYRNETALKSRIFFEEVRGLEQGSPRISIESEKY